MVTVIVAEVSPNLLSLTRHAGLILAGIPVEESESESRSKKNTNGSEDTFFSISSY